MTLNLTLRAVRIVTLLLGLLSIAPQAQANGGGASPPSIDPALRSAIADVKAERYAQAIPRLRDYTRSHPDDADAFNWLGFAQRKSGNVQASLEFYDRALAIEPEHRGAHEYRGEAYLQLGRLADAEADLAALDDICWLPCSEYRDLKQAIARYRAGSR